MPRSSTPTLVALDIETTGLDPNDDAIIEIGAVKFKGERLEGEWSTLVNPGRSLSPFITQLTGINDAMLAGAPRVGQALAKVTEFVGECDVVGHNIKFDLGFIRKKGALRYNECLDTFDLASVLIPTAGRYSLASLGAALAIPLPATHRALDDARVTFHLYRALVQKARELPLDILAEIVNLGQEIEGWGAHLAFEEALEARRKETAGRKSHDTASLFGEPPPFAKPLRPNDQIRPLDAEALARILQDDGAFAQAFPGFEHRPQQVEMLRRVARAFSEKKHLMVEAGTGTGKSLAYLIPAIHWAAQNGERVVVSTNTINLQDQLIHKDVPDLQRALNLDFRAAVLKGRSNYLCPRRFDAARNHGPKNADEMRMLAKLLVWLSTSSGPKGDRASLTLTGRDESGAWSRLSAEDEGCSTDRCVEQMGGICPFYQARRAAEAAHVLIVNHALLLTDVALENRVLPDYKILVIDEAHHLEAATTDGLSFEVKRTDMERLLKDLGGPRSGALGSLATACRSALPPEMMAQLQDEIDKAYGSVAATLEVSRMFFDAVGEFLASYREAGQSGDYALQVRLVPGARTQASWPPVERTWADLSNALKPLNARLGRLVSALADLTEYEISNAEAHASDLAATVRRLDETQTQLDGLVIKPDPKMIYWAEASSDGRSIALHAAPLAVGPLIEKHIWNVKDTVVLTSATLTTSGKFDYLRSRLNASQAVEEVSVGSPFDYQKSTLLYLVNDIPDPAERQAHQRAVEKGLIELCRATRGRALVLFTSHGQLRPTAHAIRGPLEREGVVVYDQSEGMSRHQLLENFRGNEQSVLLGTKSFWEGVDVPGEALSVLVIVKLPFDVPSDPIIAARSETFENSFYDYSVPEAVLRFRQGFGRLIRTKTDRGVVAVFDRRVLTKQYGRLFLASLPPCTRKDGPMAALPATAAKWLDG